PIGGPALGAQVSDYRCEPLVANVRPFAGAGSSDPLKTARADGFDPKEFFAETLGNAKLLGVVRLVDIVEFVLTAADIRMPTIVQELEHLIAGDVVRAVVPPILAGIET